MKPNIRLRYPLGPKRKAAGVPNPSSKPGIPQTGREQVPLAALHELASSLFSEDHFRRWIRFGLETSKLADELPGDGTSFAKLIEMGLATLVRHGHVDSTFFGKLRLEFPRRIDDIERVERLWMSKAGHSPSEHATSLSQHRRSYLGVVILAAIATVITMILRCYRVPFSNEKAENPSNAAPSLEVCPSDMIFIHGTDGLNFDGHKVANFCIDITEVTLSAHQRCVSSGACMDSPLNYLDKRCNNGYPGRDDYPVNCLTWGAAREFCIAAGKRLPTEWEWEWAARGRDAGRTFPWGEESPNCRYAIMAFGGDGCGEERTWAVGSRPDGDSRDGVKDMSGNVLEWTSTAEGTSYVMRGGAWDSDAQFLSTSARVYIPPNFMTPLNGVRCAKSL